MEWHTQGKKVMFPDMALFRNVVNSTFLMLRAQIVVERRETSQVLQYNHCLSKEYLLGRFDPRYHCRRRCLFGIANPKDPEQRPEKSTCTAVSSLDTGMSRRTSKVNEVAGPRVHSMA